MRNKLNIRKIPKIVSIGGTLAEILSDDPLTFEDLFRCVEDIARPTEELIVPDENLPKRHEDYNYLTNKTPAERCRFLLDEYTSYLRRKKGETPEKSAFRIISNNVEVLKQTEAHLYEIWEPVLEEFANEYGL